MTTAVQPNDLAYAFDPYGNSTANRVQNEYHVITADNSRRYNLLIPLKAPFFASGFSASATVAGSTFPLVEGVHFNFAFEHMTASRKTSRAIYGGIVFVDESFSGTIRLNSYQTLGGDWTLDEAGIAEIMANTLYNPRTTTWEKINGLPYEFPTIDHEHNVEDLGVSKVVEAIDRITDALGGDPSNPGSGFPTLVELGLDKVPNLPLATDPIASAATSRDHLMSPYGVRLAVMALILNDYQTFIARRDNPHEVTAAQTGAATIAQVNAILADYLGINDTAVNSTHFNNLTLAQVTAQILQGTAANSNALEGYTAAQLQALILQGTAANSMRIDGKTYAELLAAIATDTDYADYFTGQILIPRSLAPAGSLEYIFIAEGRSIADDGFQDAYMLVTGGNQFNAQLTPIWLLRYTNKLGAGSGHYGLEAMELTNTNLNVGFGLVVDSSQDPADPAIQIWMRGTSPLDEITVTLLSKDAAELMSGQAHTLVAPAGVTWTTVQRGISNSQRLGGFTAAEYMREAHFQTAITNVLAKLES